MKKCENCGYQNQDYTHYCIQCGNGLNDIQSNLNQQTKEEFNQQPSSNENQQFNQQQPINSQNEEVQDQNYQYKQDSANTTNSLDFNNGESNNQQQNNQNQQNNQQQNNQNQQNIYQPQDITDTQMNTQNNPYVEPIQTKKTWLSVLLSLFGLIFALFIGLGDVYLKLYKRYMASMVIGLLITIIFLNNESIRLVLLLIWTLYIVYDTYRCSEAINNNEKIPLFLKKFDLQ